MFPGIEVREQRPAVERYTNTQLLDTKPDWGIISSPPGKSEPGDQSPRGPLSVEMSTEGTSRSGTIDDELARTFDLRDLEAAE